MEFHDSALVVFSILAQLAVGTFLVLGIVQIYASRKAGPEQADRATGWGWWAVLVVMGAAVLASLTHLGSPMRAYMAILNVGSAWLSREILLALLFTAFLGLYTLLKWRKAGSSGMQTVVGVAAAVLGLALVFSMSMIYSYIRTQPAWDTPLTTVTFYITTLMLGSLGAGAVLMTNYLTAKNVDPKCAQVQCEILRAALKRIAVAALVLLGVQILVLPVYLNGLFASGGAGELTARMLLDDFGALLSARIILAFIGAGVFAVFLYRLAASPGSEKQLGNLAIGAFFLVLVSEVIARFLFYAAHIRVGI